MWNIQAEVQLGGGLVGGALVGRGLVMLSSKMCCKTVVVADILTSDNWK